MECIDPGRVTPDDLVAYATGETEARIDVHIAACASCAAEAAAYASVDGLLRSRLFRVDCPSTQTLGELALDLLDPGEALALRGHLALCTHCAGEFSALAQDLRDDPMAALAPAPGRLARIVARLLPAPGLTAGYAGVRGGDTSMSRSYEAEGISVSLTLEAETSGLQRRWTLLGLVVSEDGELPPGTGAALMRDGQTVARAALDDLGNVVFADVAAGDYSLELTLSDRIVVIEGLDVGDEPA